MGKPLDSAVIVGGGTAGWLTAAYLHRAFGSRLKITVIESKQIGRIGVGEATVPTLKVTFDFLGLEEREWMPRCGATFKNAVRFVDWHTGAGGGHTSFFHPFFRHPETNVRPFARPFFFKIGDGFSKTHYWQKLHTAGLRKTYGQVCGPLQRICELNKAPKANDDEGDDGACLRYAYHLDAIALADMLCERSVAAGVEHILGNVASVELADTGFISHVIMEDGRTVHGDFFVDSTGFRTLLLGGALGEPFVDQSHFLLTDAAVALQRDYDSEHTTVRPYTTSTAQPEGWTWEVPLVHREGCGYVYSSKHADRDQAERQLREFLGPRSDANEARHLRMRVGYTRRPWVKNCASVGLSSSFIEPLESTAIFLIEYTLSQLLTHFPDSDFDEVRIDQFNRNLVQMYEDIRDFIVMHYCLTDREDTDFWRDVRAAPIPDSLAERLELARNGVITPDGLTLKIFEGRSYACILSGMNFEFKKAAPALELIDGADADAFFRELEAENERVAMAMPTHNDYLRQLHGRAPG